MGPRFSSLALLVAVTSAAAFACNSSGGSQFDASGSGDGGAGGNGGAGDQGLLNGAGLDSDASVTQTGPIAIDPPTATLVVDARGVLRTQPFVAKVGGQIVHASWTLDKYDSGSIDAAGLFSTNGINGGKVKVTANYRSQKAVAEVDVVVQLAEDLTPAPSSVQNRTALGGAPTADPGGANVTKVVYPLAGTVVPRGLSAPTFQLTAGSIAPEDVKVQLKCSTFSWEGTGSVLTPASPQLTIPQDAWDAFTQSCGGEEADVILAKASGGVAYGPYAQKMIVAAATLKGAVFYQSYEGANLGLWSVKPGVKAPAVHLINQCVVCHSVSANGETLATGMSPVGAAAGAYKTSADGSFSQVAASPASPYGNGDSRGFGFAFLTPDGNYVLRAQADFWGGLSTMAFKVDKNGTATTQMPQATVNGLASVSAYVPSFSPDAKKLVFVNGDTYATAAMRRKSVTVMDADVDPATGPNGTLTFANPNVVLDNSMAGGSGLITKFPAFLPDSNQIILQEGTNIAGECNGYGGMLGNYSGSCGPEGNTGKLFLLRNGEHIELANANTGTVALDSTRNYDPFTLPVTAGGYFWVVFTSRREYGNTFTGSNVRKQLWVAAISPSTAPGVDPSHPAFFLPNQSNSANERGFWALEPCKSESASCGSGDECCDGFCRPSDEANPASSRVCKKPVVGQCSEVAEKCQQTSDCCDAPSVTCIGGFCTQPSVK